MKTFKSVVSVLIALLIVAAGLTVCFSVSAAETLGTVTVTSNISAPVSVAYGSNTNQVTVTYKLQAAKQIVNTQAYVTYDHNVLSIPETAKTKAVIPVLRYGGSTVNFSETDLIKFNATDMSLFDFTTEDVYFTLTFDVIGTGDTTVNMTVNVLTATDAPENPTSAHDIYLVRYDTINTVETYSLTPEVALINEEEPTTEPATEPATEPTTEPVVSSEDVCVVGTDETDFVLKLDSVGDSKYAGEMALPAGTYTFRMREGDQMLGYKGSITDAGNKANSFTFNPAWSSSTTLTTAQGGVFYFWYQKELNKFYMYRVEDIVDNYLVGDLNTVMRPVPGQNSAVGSMHLDAGTYKFRVSIRGIINGYSTTINDSTNGASLTFENKWKAEITLNATGGTYSFYIINNTDTNKDYFQVKYIPDDPNQSKEDVHLNGDLSAVLDDQNGESEEAVAVVTLEAGAYSFKVVDHGVDYTAGLTITEEGTKTISSLYTRALTFISANGGTYEFRYSKTAHTITITPVNN